VRELINHDKKFPGYDQFSEKQLLDLNINIVKNKLESYFGDKKEYVRDKRELEVYRGDLIR